MKHTSLYGTRINLELRVLQPQYNTRITPKLRSSLRDRRKMVNVKNFLMTLSFENS